MPDDVKTKTPEDTQPNIQASEAMLGQMISNVLAGVPANTPTMAQDISAAAGGMPNTMFNLAAPNTPEEGDRMAVDMGINKLVEFMSGQMANFQGGPQPGSRSGTATQQATPQQPQQAAQPQAAPAGPTMNEPAPPDLSFLLNNANTLATKNDKTGMTAADGAQNYIQGMQGQQKANYWEDNWGNVVQIALGALIGGIAAHNGAVGYIPIAKALAGHGQKGIHEWFRTKQIETEQGLTDLMDPNNAMESLTAEMDQAWAGYDGDYAAFRKSVAPSIYDKWAAKTSPNARAQMDFGSVVPEGGPTNRQMEARLKRDELVKTKGTLDQWEPMAEHRANTTIAEALDDPNGPLAETLTQIQAGVDVDLEPVAAYLSDSQLMMPKTDAIAPQISGNAMKLAEIAIEKYKEPEKTLFDDAQVKGGVTLEDGTPDPGQPVSIDDNELEEFPFFNDLRGKQMSFEAMKKAADDAVVSGLEFKNSPFKNGEQSLHLKIYKPKSKEGSEYTPFKGYMGGPAPAMLDQAVRERWVPFIKTSILNQPSGTMASKKRELYEQAKKNPKMFTKEGLAYIERWKKEMSD